MCIIALELAAGFFVIPVYTHMILLVSLILYLGCTNGLAGEYVEKQQRMSTEEVKRFPIVGSIVLFSLYLVYKFLPKVNRS